MTTAATITPPSTDHVPAGSRAITIYRARRIITMNPANPFASHVAVRDGRILGAGSFDEVSGWGPATLDQRYAEQILLPGFVEGHSHLMAGTMWRYVYVGFHDRTDPDGKVWPGIGSIAGVIERLRAAAVASATAGDSTSSILGWGLDPIFFGDRRCNRHDLDQVSTTRPVAVIHASFHILNVNSAALQIPDWLRAGIDHPGIPLDEQGIPLGELKGPDAMTPVGSKVGFDREVMVGDELAIRQFGKLCVRSGVTTATDLASPLTDDLIETLLRITAEPQYPVRIVPLLRLLGQSPKDLIAQALAAKARSSEQLRMGRIKVVADGSIQGFSARLRWPGYYNGAPNGLWYTAPEQIAQLYELALANDLNVHTHTNGDEATDLALDCLDYALGKQPARDHRFTLQHCQLADRAQFERMRALGMCANLFANHHFYWGDQHYRMTVGPERANRMNACSTAIACGVPFSIHSDAPVTPLGPLFTAWCAVTRLTASGRVQGEHERISIEQALRAVTLGAAYTLKLDHEIGSIETGKRADFAVLADDPFMVKPELLKDIPVLGIVHGGRCFDVATM